MKYYAILLFSILLMAFGCKTKSNQSQSTTPFDPVLMNEMWKKIDSLESKGLFASALTQVREIKRMALAEQLSGDLIKAVLFENRYLIQLEEDSATKAIARAEEELTSYPQPAKSVMHSLLAQWYSYYLQNHLWELKDRTEYGGEPGEDLNAWGIRHFLTKIEAHYTASVQWSGLQAAAVEDYLVLLTDGKETDDLRPTLYDILMHRALDYFSGSEAYLTKSPFDYVLNDPKAFDPTEDFIRHPFKSSDSTSTTLQSLHWFQDLLTVRMKDTAHAAARLDANLKRLRYVYENGIIEQKDSLYENALDALRLEHTTSPESSIVDYYLAQLYVTRASQWQRGTDDPNRYAFNKAKEICTRAIEKFPEAYGSQLCKSVIYQIGHKSLSASMESVSLPDEDLLLKLDYRNLTSIHFKLVKLPEAYKRFKVSFGNSEQMLRRLNQLPAISSWEAQFDDGGDHQSHITELAVRGPGIGHYALVVSDDDRFSHKESTTGVVMFTVSELAYWYIDDHKLDNVASILNRRTGQPEPGVKVEFYSYEYNSAIRQNEEIKIGEDVSDENGWVDVPAVHNKNLSFRLTKGEDELLLDDSYFTHRVRSSTRSRHTTLFFADRAIYRPGQKIFFKGFALNFDPDRMPSIASDEHVEVVLYDANGQEVSKQSFTANAFGTFHGHFDLPTGGLSGRMSLSSSHGSNRLYFQVEEYKRPKFEVTFDTLTDAVRLSDDVTIVGRAENYSGNPVIGAEVGYRVERVSYTPWWFGYYRRYWQRHDDRQVLATGKTITGDDGTIDIMFPATPKPGANENLMYRFIVTLSVTDITGEHHEATKSISLNRQGYEVQIDLQDRLAIEQLKAIHIDAANADGAPVKLSGKVRVSALQGPDRNKRKRLWSDPDIITLSEEDYEASFSNYMMPGKDHMADWPVNGNRGHQNISIDGQGTIDLSEQINKAGYYKIEWSWKDESDHSMQITQYTLIYAPDQLLPGHEVHQVQLDDKAYAPGEQVGLKVYTGLSSPPKTIRIVERRIDDVKHQLLGLPVSGDERISISESDRGGVYVHHLSVYNNRFYSDKHFVQVPWSNKDLDLKLKTWRDKVEPGDHETWTLTVEGHKKEQVEAEMLLSMYDASLDAFVPHQWRMSLYPTTISSTRIYDASAHPSSYRGISYNWRQNYRDVPVRQYRNLNAYGYYPMSGVGIRGSRTGHAENHYMDGVRVQKEAQPAMDAALESEEVKAYKIPMIEEDKPMTAEGQDAQTTPALRSALDETVFFYPQIKTDEHGHLTFSFKMKEGLTRWKFQALGHTRDLAFGLTQEEIVTQKKLMVFPNPPRFFRERDTITFQSKVVNLTDEHLSGKAVLKIIDAFSGEDVSVQWGITNIEQGLTVEASGATQVNWDLEVPDGWVRPVKYEVYAMAGDFSDGETSFLPVVTNRILITETLPLPVKANENRTFVFQSMLKNKSATSVDHGFTVEMTTSPAWYAVQALPYLMEFPHECAEQVFSRLYANSLAAHILEQKPTIRKVYDAWRVAESDALISNLSKNQELKSAMIEETPWVRDAMGETQQKKNIALLFDENRLNLEGKEAITRLRQMQTASGGFPWFPGGRDSWYITQYIVEGFGHLHHLGVDLPTGRNDLVEKAMPYLDMRMIEWYKELKRREAKGDIKMSDHHLGSMQIHYYYATSFFPEIKHRSELDEINAYVLSQIEKYWLKHGLYNQGLMALVSQRHWAESGVSKEILASLRERTIYHEELGRYWKMRAGYYWNEAPVEFQSLMVEVFQEMGVDQAETDELRVWLLKNKQTTQWKTTKATASAIYALLIHPDSWLESVGEVEVSLGKQKVIGEPDEGEPGTGYVKKSWDGDEIDDDWSSIEVTNPNNHIAWGSAYWQYWEDLDKVKSSVEDNPLKVSRQLLKVEDTEQGEVTDLAPGRALNVGDKLVVRLIVETDRAMEFVHLKDLRASGFEPMDVLSGYRWKSGMGYYQSTKDLASHFFIDYLPRGKYVIEYPVTVAQAGAYSEGLASLQCMYAPEFGSHSEGSRVAATWKESKN